MSSQITIGRLIRSCKQKHRLLMLVTIVFFSFFIGAVPSMGNDVSTKMSSEALIPSSETENNNSLEDGEEPASHEDDKNNGEGIPEEIKESEEYSGYPKNFIIPKGTCDLGEPAIVFSE